MLCCPYAFLPPMKFWDHCQVALTDLQVWIQEQAAIPAWVPYENRWGQNNRPGLGLPLDWFTSDQQQHVVAHQIRSLPTMTVLVECSEHRNVRLCTRCLLCSGSPETAHHLWECPVQSHERWLARQRLHTWPSTCVGTRASQVQGQLWGSAVREQ